MAEQNGLYSYPDFTNNAGIPSSGGDGPFNAPTYRPSIPPSSLKIYLVSETNDLEFFEEGVSAGYGKSVDIVYNSSLQFNGPKTYTANLDNGKVLSKFIINTKQLQYTNEIVEGIGVTEYTLVDDVWEEQQTQNFNFGTISLRFKTEVARRTQTPPPPPADVVTVDNPMVGYEILFDSNIKELTTLRLKYQIVFEGNIGVDGELQLSDNHIGSIPKNVLDGAVVNFEIKGNVPDGIFIKNIYSGTTQQFGSDSVNYDRLTKQNYAFQLPASLLNAGLGVVIEAEKEIKTESPVVVLNQTQYNVNVKDSDTEKSIVIPFNTQFADSVLVYLSADKVLEIPSSDKEVTLFFQKDYNEVYGSKKIFFVPTSKKFGTGTRVEAIVTFTAINDFPAITEVIYAQSIDVPSFSDFNIDYEVSYSSFAVSSVDVWLKQKDGSKVGLLNNQPPNGSIKINLKKLRENYPNWVGSNNITLILKPYNRSGAEELIGNEYEVLTKLTLPTLSLNEDIITNALFNAFSEKLKIDEPSKESKYLTHLANFGNDEQIIISSWETDDFTLSKKSTDNLGNTFVAPNDVVNSIILKLYSPLPANIQNNSTFWITKLMSNPLIETVVLTENNDVSCPPIKGPNFTIDVDFVKGQSTNYESLDNIILDGSTSSNELVSLYLSSSLITTDELNIEYSSGSTYLWENFVHFSSANERIANFVYKVQLIEVYETALAAANASQAHSGSLPSIQEAERQQLKKNQLVNGFDGFEKFLYTSSSLSWPYNGATRRLSTSNEVSNWYTNIEELANIYDANNSNYVLNNIPQYIVNNDENESLLLFFSMIGHHFDNIYFHTKSIEKSRGLGYKAKDGISDKLLFDTLKSFSWDAKNLAADADLWSYVFGKDKEGNDKESNPAKQRTNEVWRRIVNNLPYLLKHKGTRRGIHALMACYGIPSSNLSILEFGGPEVSDTSKSKLVIDNITTGLNMTLTSSIEMEWKQTNNTSSLKPNTIELFVKPLESSQYTLISGSGWNVNLVGSANSDYGKVEFNYSGSQSIETSTLPIFNGKYFGVSVSSGSAGLKLDVRQADKERTIFQESISSSNYTNWNSGSTIRLGGNYIGSVDEFRLWSEVLDTERFYEHVSFPEMINGNSVSSSTDDLYFRLDFEYPKNLAQTSSLINVDTNIYYPSIYLPISSQSLQLTRNYLETTGSIEGVSLYSLSVNTTPLLSASAYGFDVNANSGSYPYQFEVIDRTIVMDYPDGGASRFSTNKIRFEDQYTLTNQKISGSVGVDLSIKSRATKKAFDQSPTDSNRVGLFFSPTKELNMDIAKTFGGLNIDNYIGDPSDDYKPNYKSLDNLRNYYFQRFDNRDIYSYINLIKLYEKSMFEDLKKMLPARVKATTGLLIEPHFLERSKVVHKKPTADDYQQETEIKLSDTSVISFEDIQKETLIDANISQNLTVENNQYEALISTASVNNLLAENYQQDSTIDMNSNFVFNSDYYQKEISINAELGDPTIITEIDIINSNQVIGQSEYETIGFGIYSQNGSAIRTYFNKDNRVVKERIKVQLVTEEKERIVQKFAVTASANGLGDPRGGYVSDIETYTETKLNIQPFDAPNSPTVGGNVIEVKNVNGYLPTHNKFTSDLTRGLQNSFFRGSKNTSATTLDGSSPIETFTSNPNTLRVNKTGRDSSEPILEVE
jgi:hypothetical protein